MYEGTHDSRAVANEIIKMGIKDRRYFTPLQLMKLVYYCHAWMLGIHEKGMISHKVKAWKYGPVITELYGETRRYGGSKIKSALGYKEFDYEFEETFTKDESDLIYHVYDHYSEWTGRQLSSMTHMAGTPWHKIRSSTGDQNKEIPNEMIQEYYGRKFREPAQG